MTIVEFLMAQIEADEAVARAAMEDVGGDVAVARLPDTTFTHVAKWGPARVLRECATKRAIVEMAVRLEAHDDMGSSTREDGDQILRALASVYADREGFDAGWLG